LVQVGATIHWHWMLVKEIETRAIHLPTTGEELDALAKDVMTAPPGDR
jgi:hypothetical protein